MYGIVPEPLVILLKSQTFLKLLTLFLIPWITYGGILRGSWVSDDWLGIAAYDGKLARPVTFSSIFRWLRWQFGRKLNPDYRKKNQPHFVQSNVQNHRLNIWFACGTSVLAYHLLGRLVGDTVAFYAVLLWMVHPLGVQCIGWISGIPYAISPFFIFLSLIWVSFSSAQAHIPLVASYLIFVVLHSIAVQVQFNAWATAIILAFMGRWDYAVLSLLVSFLNIMTAFREAVLLRRSTFNEQNMGYSSYFRLAKFYVVFKSLAYYIFLILFPKRLGLYHTYGYHYEMPKIEMEDRLFWIGLAILPVLVGVALLGPPPIRFGIAWFLSFILLFLNWITVHQFVTERYAWLPSLGWMVILSFLVHGSPYLMGFYWILFGLALMRTWTHIPTYYDELSFYLSNVWNYPNSEVATGNLGVTYSRLGLLGCAIDIWNVGTRINPDYDVNWYNLYSMRRTHGNLGEARELLLKAISSPTCHFQKLWSQEIRDLELEMRWMEEFNHHPDPERWAWAKESVSQVIKGTSSPLVERWAGKLKVIEEELAKRRIPTAQSGTSQVIGASS